MEIVNPKILITGHPNSGTSFLCNLVVEMSFYPGDRSLLKPPDRHNPHGYWEHVPLQNYVRNLSGYGDWMHVTGSYPPEPLSFTEEEKRRTALLFDGAGVEVFKETGLPVMYELFPHDSQYLVITRDKRAMYESAGANYRERGISFDKFCRSVDAYNRLVDRMREKPRLVGFREVRISCVVFRYEDFRDDFDNQVLDVADVLGVKADLPRLREIWKPRDGRAIP